MPATFACNAQECPAMPSLIEMLSSLLPVALRFQLHSLWRCQFLITSWCRTDIATVAQKQNEEAPSRDLHPLTLQRSSQPTIRHRTPPLGGQLLPHNHCSLTWKAVLVQGPHDQNPLNVRSWYPHCSTPLGSTGMWAYSPQQRAQKGVSKVGGLCRKNGWMPTAADCGEAAAAGQAASYRTAAHLRGEVQLSSIHSSGCPVHSAVYGVSCCVKGFLPGGTDRVLYCLCSMYQLQWDGVDARPLVSRQWMALHCLSEVAGVLSLFRALSACSWQSPQMAWTPCSAMSRPAQAHRDYQKTAQQDSVRRVPCWAGEANMHSGAHRPLRPGEWCLKWTERRASSVHLSAI